MRISKKSRVLASGLGLVALVAGALIVLMRPESQAVRLLHVGYADYGERGRSPLFCLTNGGRKSITYLASYSGRPAFAYKVRTPTGWEGPYPFRGIGGAGSSFSQTNVLKPGESLTFEFARPMGPRGWKMGIAYRTCSFFAPSPPPPATVRIWTTANGAQMLPFTNGQFIAFFPSKSSALQVPKPSLASKASEALPRLVPGWLKRALQSMDRDSVAWGPEMK